jgi:hypothetical protein
MDAPSPGEHTADEGVVDPQLTSLLSHPLVRRGTAAIEALGVAGMQAGQHGPADVVQDGRECDLVAVPDATELGHPVGGTLHIQCVEAESVRGEGQAAVPVEDVVGRCRAKNRLHGARAESLDSVGDAADAPPALQLSGCADDRAGQPDVRLDDAGDLVWRRPAVDLLESLVAALLESGLALGLVESGSEDAPAALPSGAILGATRCGRSGCHEGLIGTAWPIV